MARHSSRRSTADSAGAGQMKTARRVSMIIGLTLAVAAATTYITLFRVPASAAPKVASHKAITLLRLAEFTLASAPDSVQLDPDGTMVVVATSDGKVNAWSTSRQRQHRSFASVPDGTAVGSLYGNPLVFSPNGKELSVIGSSSSGGYYVYIWNVATGKATSVPLPLISSPYPPPGYPNFVAPGPNGLIATSDPDGILGIVATATGRLDAKFLLNRHGGIAYATSEPVFSPDGKTIAVSDDLGKIYLANAPRKHLAAALTAEKIYNTEWNMNGMVSFDIDTLTFSPDSKLIACGSEIGIIRVWDARTGRNMSAFSVNGSASGGAAARPVKTLVFSPDDKILVSADNADSTVAIWDTASGRRVATLEAGTGNVASAAFTANGTLIVVTTSNNASHHSFEIWITGQSLQAG